MRWYSQAPEEDAGLNVALDHAQRLLRPGSRVVLLADPRSIADIPERRWPALAQHHEVIVLLLTDPLETAPPKSAVPFSSGGHRIDVDLASPAQRQRWLREFAAPAEAAIASLPSRGVRVQALSTDEPSESWLPLLGRARPMVA